MNTNRTFSSISIILITLTFLIGGFLFVRNVDAHNTPVFNQSDFWWRDDDGSESAATGFSTSSGSDAAINEHVGGVPLSATARLRLRVDDVNGAKRNNLAHQLEFSSDAGGSCTAGTWSAVGDAGTGNTWDLVASANFTDGDPTTQQIGADTFVAGSIHDTNVLTNVVSFNDGVDESSEFEWHLESNGAANSQTYWFRVVDDGGALLDNYNVCPALTTESAGNSTPDEPSNVTLNNNSDIILSPSSTVSVVAKASTTDPDGAGDIDFATSVIARSGVGLGCTDNDNNCYRLPSSSCVFNGATTTVNCTANIQYFADPTDASSTDFSAEDWQSQITVTDKAGAQNGSTTASGVELNTLWAINLVPATIDYGSLNPNSTSTNQTTTVKNVGNAALDIELDGIDMSDLGFNTIVPGQQKYATSTISNWDTCSACTALSETPTRLGVDLPKPTNTGDVSDDVFWMLSVPDGTASSTYSGTNTYGAVGD